LKKEELEKLAKIEYEHLSNQWYILFLPDDIFVRFYVNYLIHKYGEKKADKILDIMVKLGKEKT